jgi:hypothetical protein
MGIVEVKKSIRKAVEIPLFFAMKDQGISIEWPGLPLDRKQVLPQEYLNVSHGFGDPIPLETGPNPRWQTKGLMSVMVRTPVGTGVDRNDAIAGIVCAAYPYGQVLIQDDVSVVIDKIGTDGYGMDGAWMFSTVKVNWICYRRA